MLSRHGDRTSGIFVVLSGKVSLGFFGQFGYPEALNSLFHNRPDLGEQLRVGEKMAENYALEEASLRKSKVKD